MQVVKDEQEEEDKRRTGERKMRRRRTRQIEKLIKRFHYSVFT